MYQPIYLSIGFGCFKILLYYKIDALVCLEECYYVIGGVLN